MARKGEEGEVGRQEEMRGCSHWQTQQWLDCLLQRETEGGRGGGVPRQRKVPASLHQGGRGRFLSENRETDLVVMSEREHLPSKDFAKWHRGPESECQFSLCNRRGRKWAGSVELSGKSHVWRTRAREETGRNMQPWYVRKTSVFYVCMVFYSWQDTDPSTLKPHRDPGGQHLIMLVQMKKQSPRNRWDVWLQELLPGSKVLLFFLLHLNSFSGAGLHYMGRARRALSMVMHF